MAEKKFNVGALVAWVTGAAFLVPASKLGLEQAFGFGETLSWCAALSITVMGSIGAGLARNGGSWFESLVGSIVAAGGLLLAVGSDSASLWERMRSTHRAPAEVAESAVAGAEAILASTSAEIATVKEALRAKLEEAAMEGRSGKGPNYAALQEQASSLRSEIASLEARRTKDTQALSTARREAAGAKASSYWLAETEWGPWALLGFAALFETLLVLVGFLIVSPARSPKTGAAEVVAAPREDLAVQAGPDPGLPRQPTSREEAVALRRWHDRESIALRRALKKWE